MNDTFLASSPFHKGEQAVQARQGVRHMAEQLGRRMIRDWMPDQHRDFYAQLPFLLLGSVDAEGRPWASILMGRPGFIQSPNPTTLVITAQRVHGDPLNQLKAGDAVGLLGMQYATRRRNRMNATIVRIDTDGMELRVDQAFGNCPQYIHQRDPEILPALADMGSPRPTQTFTQLNSRAKEIIAAADHFYIASYYREDASLKNHGADVSHRGGRPGFVRIDDDQTLTFPDFSGNNHFNTLGNIAVNPKAGLLFLDFENGDLVYLTARAEIIWDSAERRAFTGADRLVRFILEEGVHVAQALPFRWSFTDFSPSIEGTGNWADVDETLAQKKAATSLRDYRVTHVVSESSTIKSFYLEPTDGQPLPTWEAGQFLPIEVTPPGVEKPLRRTYTIATRPNEVHLRLSIKREPARAPGQAPGQVSNYFHDHVKAGDVIRARSPRGKFVLKDHGNRPVVLLSAGVGITPVLSMLEQFQRDNQGCGRDRQFYFIHGARNSAEHAFGAHIKELTKAMPCIHVTTVYSQPLETDREGRDYDDLGRVDTKLLKRLLPLDDYDFYFCGPPAFMQEIHRGLKDLNIRDDRIHYEFFGPGLKLSKDTPEAADDAASSTASSGVPTPVRFAKSDVQATWNPSSGTLLELAESVGLAPAYSCRSGSCGTCETRIIEGEVSYAEAPLAETRAGYALTCSARPKPGGMPLVLEV